LTDGIKLLVPPPEIHQLVDVRREADYEYANDENGEESSASNESVGGERKRRKAQRRGQVDVATIPCGFGSRRERGIGWCEIKGAGASDAGNHEKNDCACQERERGVRLARYRTSTRSENADQPQDQ
jgi:hypothetical protein